MKFCGQCGQLLQCVRICTQCQFENPLEFKFCGNCSAALASPKVTNSLPTKSDPTPTRPAPGKPTQGAERRQLTVLFCDMVGSTKLSESVDPEDLRDIMRGYRNTCDEVIHRFNGHIAQYLGDGILTYFGFPQAHEDDASRAVQASLQLIHAIDTLNLKLRASYDVELALRIGIHTGLVVVGEIGDGDKRSLALGETPNIAARLQDLAECNGIVISAATHQLIQDRFQCQSLGEQKLKGLSRQFEIFKVDKAYERRLTHTDNTVSGNMPMIGREQESALLLDRLDQAMHGMGQVVLLSGEAGIGKSRLTQFVRDNIPKLDHYLIEAWGSPYYQNSYLHCAIGTLRRLLDFDCLTTVEEKLKEIETPLAKYGLSLTENVPLLADLLSVPLPDGRYPQHSLTPQQIKQNTLNLLVEVILSVSNQRQVIIIVEDLQWVDPTTLELLGMLIEQAPTGNIFALLTYRTEFIPTWTHRSHVTHITINPLTRKQSGKMVNWLTGGKKLPIEVFNKIINKTDGTPIFVEELTKMVLASNILKEHKDYYELTAPITSISIPTTLQDSLMAKLDQLGPEKELAQLSATIGREFNHNLLKAVANKTEDFENRLAQLVVAEMLYQRGLPPKSSYTFRHALVHEVAYQSLLKKTRQQYHQHIATVLAQQFNKIVEENPEVLAHHCHEAGDYHTAVVQWLNAGHRALRHSANLDALSHLKKGLEGISHLPESAETTSFELSLNVALGLAAIMCKGYAAPEVESAYARAYTLSSKVGENSTVFPILCGLWEFYVVRAELDTATELARKLQIIAKQSTDPALSIEAQRALGSVHFWRGEVLPALEHLKRGIDANVSISHRRIFTYSHSQDTEVSSLANASCVSWLMGKQHQALQLSKQSIDLAIEINHPFTTTYAQFFHGIAYQLSGDVANTLMQAEKTIALSEKYDFVFWQPTGKMLKSWALMQGSPTEEYLAMFEEDFQAYRLSGARVAIPFFTALLVGCYLQLGKSARAIPAIDQCLQQINQSGQRFFEPELYRLKAAALLMEEDVDQINAEEQLHHAINLATQQSSHALLLRASCDLCRLWQQQGNHTQAKHQLTSVLELYDARQTSVDLSRAAELLADLN